MARGSKVDIEEYLTSLEEFLKLGCSMHEACVHSGIPYTTMVDYCASDENVRRKIERWGNNDILVARQSVIKGMKEDAKLSMDYLKNKKSDEFSLKSQQDINASFSIDDMLEGTDEPTANEITGE